MKQTGGTIDIETYPGEYRAFADNMYEAKLMKETKPIAPASFSYKDWFSNKTITKGVWDYPTELDFVKALWKVFDENDFIVGQNVKKFDNKQSNTFFGQFGLPKHSPVKFVDTMLIAKQHFRLPSYSLKYLLVFFKIGLKLETGGESLWFACEEGDPKARKKMLVYNKNDTIQTELLAKFFIEKGYAKLPDKKTTYVIGEGCVRCGEEDMQSRGESPTSGGWAKMFVCKNCGKWNRTDVVRGYAHS